MCIFDKTEGPRNTTCVQVYAEWNGRTPTVGELEEYWAEARRQRRAQDLTGTAPQDSALRLSGGHRGSATTHAEARRQARKHLRDCVVRQKGHCAICEGLLPGDLAGVHMDHKRALADGGTSEPDNTQAVHAICNLVKGARDFYPTDDAS